MCFKVFNILWVVSGIYHAPAHNQHIMNAPVDINKQCEHMARWSSTDDR